MIKTKESIKDARPMMDLMAKKIFSNPEITAQFIRDILDLPVHHVKILDGTQIHNHQFEDIKTYVTSIDVLAELNDGTQVIIEIQVAYQFDFIKRLWLYLCNQVTKNADEHKKEGVETHRLAEEMLPVYSIAIMQKRYFNDEEMIHVYCHKERKRNDELKVHFKGFEEEQNLSLMAFLELEKYNKDKIQEYNKVRWIEFFGNQPYTQTPEKNFRTSGPNCEPSRLDKGGKKNVWRKNTIAPSLFKLFSDYRKGKERCHKSGFDRRNSRRKSTWNRVRKENDDYQLNQRWTSLERRRRKTIKYISH